MTLGVLMLDTRFPRIPGDIGNPASFPYPVLFETVPSATVGRIVGKLDGGLLEPFVEAGRKLIGRGATRLSTSCGFLYPWQEALERALSVPVVSSSLLLLPRLPSPGVLSFEPGALALDFPLDGLRPEDSLYRTLSEDLATLDRERAEMEVLAAGERLLRKAPQVRSVVLECTNFGPYRGALEAALRLPVYGLIEALGIIPAQPN